MKVFVTGGTGYVGKWVVKELLEKGHEVKGLCRNQQSADALSKLGVTPVIGINNFLLLFLFFLIFIFEFIIIII